MLQKLFRRILSFILRFLCKLTIAKHDHKFIVVSGNYGLDLFSQIISEMLYPEYTIRRQIFPSSWDFSIPLGILGYEDKRYSFLGWISIIFKTLFTLFLSKKSSNWIVLRFSSQKQEIVDYWLQIVDPEVTVILNHDKNVLDLYGDLCRKTKSLLVVSSDLGVRKIVSDSKISLIEIGKDPASNVILNSVTELKKGSRLSMEFNINDEHKSCDYTIIPKGRFMVDLMVVAIATLKGLGLSDIEVSEKLLRAEVDLDDVFEDLSK
ncbi:hypothetical protein JW887_05340 [Candidatus Dojkabacteria bacterium]|nr:hypothetical protein [Candidatus Dojkabacteria bacterium]